MIYLEAEARLYQYSILAGRTQGLQFNLLQVYVNYNYAFKGTLDPGRHRHTNRVRRKSCQWAQFHYTTHRANVWC